MSQKSEAASHAYWKVVWHRGKGAVEQRRTVKPLLQGSYQSKGTVLVSAWYH